MHATLLGEKPGSGWVACLCVKRQTTNDICYAPNSQPFYHWSSSTNTWSKLTWNVNFGGNAGAAMDPKRNRILLVGSYSGNMAPLVLDLTGKSPRVCAVIHTA